MTNLSLSVESLKIEIFNFKFYCNKYRIQAEKVTYDGGVLRNQRGWAKSGIFGGLKTSVKRADICLPSLSLFHKPFPFFPLYHFENPNGNFPNPLNAPQ